MVLWYCVSIIGFDVHTCNASGRSFVSTLLSGYTCEDIHPEHSCLSHGHDCCHDRDCCSHEDGCCDGDDSLESSACCQDNIGILSITGLNHNDDQRHYDAFLADLYVRANLYDTMSSSGDDGTLRIPIPGSGLSEPGDTQALLGIWRI